MYRTAAPRGRLNPPPPFLSPYRAFTFGMRKRDRWPVLLPACVLGAILTTPIRYAFGWRDYDVRVFLLNGAGLAIVMFLLDMARGYRRAFCVRAGFEGR